VNMLKMSLVLVAFSVCLNSFGFKLSGGGCLDWGPSLAAICWFFACCGMCRRRNHKVQTIHRWQNSAIAGQQYASISRPNWESSNGHHNFPASYPVDFVTATCFKQGGEANHIVSTELTGM
jgi:hypothetical protein